MTGVEIVQSDSDLGVISHRLAGDTTAVDGSSPALPTAESLARPGNAVDLYRLCYRVSRNLSISLPPIVAVAHAYLYSQGFAYVYGHNPFMLNPCVAADGMRKAETITVPYLRRCTGKGVCYGVVRSTSYPTELQATEAFYDAAALHIPGLTSYMVDNPYRYEDMTPVDAYPNVFDAVQALTRTLNYYGPFRVKPMLMAYVVYRLGTECLDLADLTLSDYAQHRRRGNSMNLPACTMDLTAYGDSVMGGHAGMFRTAKRRLFRSLPTSVRYAPPDWLSMS